MSGLNEALRILKEQNIKAFIHVGGFEGCIPAAVATLPIESEEFDCRLGEAHWRCSTSLLEKGGILDGEVKFVLVEGNVENCNVSVAFELAGWSTRNYVLMPAAAYDGNRFKSIRMDYPPFLHEHDGIGPDMPITITDVPRLELEEGPSFIHLRSGDMATPCVGIHMPEHGRGFLLLFEPITPYGYTGIRLEEDADRKTARLRIEAPAVRQRIYAMMNTRIPSEDKGQAFSQGDVVVLRFRIVLFECADVPALFDAFFDHRKDLCGSDTLVHGLPLSTAFRIMEGKYNATQFNEENGYYMLGPNAQGQVYGDWQAGWCGGGIDSLAFLYDGDELSRKRANRTVDSIFGYLQNPNGYVIPMLAGKKPLGDDHCHKERTGVLLVRKNGDILVFSARHIMLTQRRGLPVPERWMNGLRRLADAFVRLWDRYGQFGQFIDIDNETILQGGTASGSMVPGGLVMAWKLLGDEKYLRVAEASAIHYYEKYVRAGIINGGPGEILQNVDSESTSNMLESYVAMYEITGDRRWLPMAEDTARQCASWCVSYDFTFPADTHFGRMGMHTLGSVYASVQNKHSAPGFCTLSGASLFRLFRATGDRRYLQMCRETAHNITQYLSRDDRPIHTWWEDRTLPSGWMCERVNMSDWEGLQKIGDVFYASCWCERSCLLAYSEIPGIYLLADTGEVVVVDHVDVTVTDAGDSWQLLVHNPTGFDADVKLFAESRLDLDRPWEQCVLDGCRVLPVASGCSVVVQESKRRKADA
jgi:hypothetical protein